MSAIETAILSDPLDVDRRLAEMALNRGQLLRVVNVARSAGANVTSFHCANAGGTYSYQQGTWALRHEFVGKDWRLDRPEGVEAILNNALQIRIAFSNVDLSCNDFHQPKPRSQKGSGAERVCIGNLFGHLPHFAPKPKAGNSTYYLMVDENGRAELSCPVVANNTFSAFIERIYLYLGDEELIPVVRWDDDSVRDFDPQVARK